MVLSWFVQHNISRFDYNLEIEMTEIFLTKKFKATWGL